MRTLLFERECILILYWRKLSRIALSPSLFYTCFYRLLSTFTLNINIQSSIIFCLGLNKKKIKRKNPFVRAKYYYTLFFL